MDSTPVSKCPSRTRKPSRDMPVSTLMWTFSVPPLSHGCGAVRLRLGQGGHRLGDAVLDQLGHHGRGRVAQDQNGRLNAARRSSFASSRLDTAR